MTKTTHTRQLRLLILDVLSKHMDSIPDGVEFYLTSAIMDYVQSVYADNQEPVSVRDRIIAAMQGGTRRAQTIDSITDIISKKLKINPSGKRWEEFIEFAYRQSKVGESIERFCDWWLENGGEPKYWSQDRMRTMWPQAFIKNEQQEVEYTRYDPEEDKQYAPPPKEIPEVLRK